ncbi:PEP-CTERM sorting domain-containing protein [Pelomonas sp. SE-A7]|uniref:PEP-CTERM sorting domain-containing protein n=1 Tax=Pelomonas sp. SE-A7 TaxID=3054953 RepID=UPI00259CA1F7|nr:PEP-CTERM sorting domain-containing protein [Pelomonas sp. SE-A7]MDM4768348.1 PEP-CTERM sorting domain-containing protein [Pelomonas sp. SE-A7]
MLKNITRKTLALAALALAFGNANAGLIGSIEHQYGSAAGKIATASTTGGCDTLNTNSITVRDGSNCGQRFVDLFDFTALNMSSVEKFVLTLNFASNNGVLEWWAARPADSTVHGSASNSLLNTTGSTAISQSFTFTSSLDVFNPIVNNDKFYLWFVENGPLSQNFTLNSAKLEVYGTAVPEPTSLALLAAAGLGLVAVRRKGSKRA